MNNDETLTYHFQSMRKSALSKQSTKDESGLMLSEYRVKKLATSLPFLSSKAELE